MENNPTQAANVEIIIIIIISRIEIKTSPPPIAAPARRGLPLPSVGACRATAISAPNRGDLGGLLRSTRTQRGDSVLERSRNLQQQLIERGNLAIFSRLLQ